MSGVTDFITGAGNRRLERKADKANKKSDKALDRLVQMYDDYLLQLKGEDTSGGIFDADSQIRMADEVSARGQEIDTASAASNAAILGYRKGDSVPIDAVKAVNQDYDLQRRAQRFDIRQKVRGNRLNAYANKPIGALGAAAGGYGNQAQGYLAQMQDPSAFFRAALQYGSASQGGGA